MTNNCDKCGEPIENGYITIRNASYNDGLISMIKSRMEVHTSCHEEMKKSDEWEI